MSRSTLHLHSPSIVSHPAKCFTRYIHGDHLSCTMDDGGQDAVVVNTVLIIHQLARELFVIAGLEQKL